MNLSRFAYTYVNDTFISEEIVQEVFFNLWEKRHCIQIHTSIRSFLYTSVRNRALNYLRSQKTRAAHEDAFAREQVTTLSSIENIWEQEQLEKSIHQAVSELPEKCRQIFELSRNENLSYMQIAAQLGISPKTVENQMSIAIKKLKCKLSGYLNLLLNIFY